MSVIGCALMNAGRTNRYFAHSRGYDYVAGPRNLEGVGVHYSLHSQDGGYWAGARSYAVFTFRDDGVLDAVQRFDVYGSTSNALAMANYLNSIPAGKAVLVVTNDEPEGNHRYSALVTAMNRVGAGATYSSAFAYRSAYMLLGKAGVGYGNGREFYNASAIYVAFTFKEQTLMNVVQY